MKYLALLFKRQSTEELIIIVLKISDAGSTLLVFEQ